MRNAKLQKLYQQVDQCQFCKAERNQLQHIHGFGVINPRLMLILINPTHRNLSSNPGYKGNRFPFIGVRQFWKVLADGGLVDRDVAYRLPLKKDWTEKHTEQIQQELIRNKLFLTNVVKCCYSHSAYPDGKVVKDQMKILADEIRIVNPKKIVAFGGLVQKTLRRISGLNIPVMPCYFPIGRGSPRKAVEILKKLV